MGKCTYRNSVYACRCDLRNRRQRDATRRFDDDGRTKGSRDVDQLLRLGYGAVVDENSVCARACGGFHFFHALTFDFDGYAGCLGSFDERGDVGLKDKVIVLNQNCFGEALAIAMPAASEYRQFLKLS